jgi:hypothetical protein
LLFVNTPQNIITTPRTAEITIAFILQFENWQLANVQMEYRNFIFEFAHFHICTFYSSLMVS